MQFSRRSAVDASPSPLAMALEAARAKHPSIIDLTLSNPTRAALDYGVYAGGARAGVFSAADGSASPDYDPDPLGAPGARAAIAEHWHGRRRPDPGHVLLLPSSSEAYHYLLSLLCDEGDSVLAPEPSYPLLSHLARYAGVRLRPYRLAYDGAWHIDLDSVRRARTERTRAIVLISPNNPTGSLTTHTELAALANLGLPLVSDEVFARYAPEALPSAPASALHATDALTFCIDGLSKSAGLPHVKLSWIAASGPPELVSDAMERLSWMADTYLSVATPVQRALPDLLSRATLFRAGLSARLRENRAALIAALDGSAASVLHADGGWYAVVRLPDVAPEEDWVLALSNRHGVLVHPGHFYDFDGALPHLVISLIVKPEELRRGAAAIRAEVALRTQLARGE